MTLLAVATGLSLPAQAAWLDLNLRNGMEMAISGTVSPSFTKTRSVFQYKYGDNTIYPAGTSVEQILLNQNRRDADERMRLSGVGTSSIGFSLNQRLTKNWTAYAYSVLYGAHASDWNYEEYWYPANFYANYGITLTHDKHGAIGLSTGNLLKEYIGDTGTFDLSAAEGSAINVSYTSIPDLKVKAYWAFPRATDVRSAADTGIHGGYGVAVSYLHHFMSPRHNLGGEIAFANTDRHDGINSANQNTLAKDRQSYTAALAYQHDKVKLTLEAGKSAEELGRAATAKLDKVDARSYGARVDYEFTPELSVYAAYGNVNYEKEGATSFADLGSVSEYYVFKNVKADVYKAGISYQLFRNISLRGDLSHQVVKNYVDEGYFSRTEYSTATIGTSFSF